MNRIQKLLLCTISRLPMQVQSGSLRLPIRTCPRQGRKSWREYAGASESPPLPGHLNRNDGRSHRPDKADRLSKGGLSNLQKGGRGGSEGRACSEVHLTSCNTADVTCPAQYPRQISSE